MRQALLISIWQLSAILLLISQALSGWMGADAHFQVSPEIFDWVKAQAPEFGSQIWKSSPLPPLVDFAILSTTKSPEFCNPRRMGRLVRDDRKATVTQINTCYNQGMQNTISECTTHQTLKQMGYSSRRQHRVPLLSAKNRKRRLQFTQAHQNWTIEDWKNIAWSDDESRFLLRHSDVGSEFGVKNMKAWIHPALTQRFRLVVV